MVVFDLLMLDSTQLRTIAQVIRWAANVQYSLLTAYEKEWGMGGKADIWPVFGQLLHQELPQRMAADQFSVDVQTQLIEYLLDPQSDYHLEMSSDEMAFSFLASMEKK